MARKLNTKIKRSYGEIILPTEIYDEIKSRNMFICVNKTKRYKQVFVCAREAGKITYRERLAKLVLGSKDGLHIDHIDRNPLNNAASNLRFCSQKQNSRNRSKNWKTKLPFKGVIRRKSGWYYAVLRADGIRYSAGKFKTAKLAAKEYDSMAKIYFKEFASLNFEENR